MTFSPRAIEAAAKAIYEQGWEKGWDNSQAHDRDHYFGLAKAALSAALAVDGVALQGWQPIESAPVGDDDFFLVCGVGDDRSAFVVRGSILKNAHKANTPSHLHMHWLTHWMALPAPPPASDGEELPSPPQQWKP